MRIACLGGGPAGLYFAIAMKLRDPAHEIAVIERNRASDTFGWALVLSDEALANLGAVDRQSSEAIAASFVSWTTSPCTTEAASRARLGTASAALAASGCSTSCRSGPARSGSS